MTDPYQVLGVAPTHRMKKSQKHTVLLRENIILTSIPAIRRQNEK